MAQIFRGPKLTPPKPKKSLNSTHYFLEDPNLQFFSKKIWYPPEGGWPQKSFLASPLVRAFLITWSTGEGG